MQTLTNGSVLQTVRESRSLIEAGKATTTACRPRRLVNCGDEDRMAPLPVQASQPLLGSGRLRGRSRRAARERRVPERGKRTPAAVD